MTKKAMSTTMKDKLTLGRVSQLVELEPELEPKLVVLVQEPVVVLMVALVVEVPVVDLVQQKT